ncbi:GAK system CofD-like protein [Pseudodesulfovibrio sediminis]|nr:GAK system CofD-like protein [Pseudodesulfovibrio sediminis]
MPDQIRLERCRQNPAKGPAILFFSGGSALRETSRQLIHYTHNSIHLITPFDSGGSSAVLRRAFSMPAVGDIRNRLMALADQSVHGNNGVYALFTHRLSKRSSQKELRRELERMENGSHFLIHVIPGIMNDIVRQYMTAFMRYMPDDFNLAGASVGNLILTAGYLASDREMEQVIETFSELARVRGKVFPVVDLDLHLAARLGDGSIVVGQHLMTGKEAAPLSSPIKQLWLTRSLDVEAPVHHPIQKGSRDRIAAADLICYPPGSFYSSVVANLLPEGVGQAIAENPCFKVFVPSTGHDPEAEGLSVADRTVILLEHLRASGAPEGGRVLDGVLLDLEKGEYDGGVDVDKLRELGLEVLDSRLVSEDSAPDLDGHLLTKVLVSLAR